MNLKQCIQNIISTIELIISNNIIFMFHHVTNEPLYDRSGCKLDTKKFDDFLKSISCYKNLCSVKEVLSSYDKRDRKVAITFDDGLEDTFTIAYPILKRYKIPFTVFVLSDFIGKEGYLNIQQLKRLDQDSLVTIEVHGSKHKVLTEIDDKSLNEELSDSRKSIEEYLQHKCEIFAYSHGKYNRNIIKIVQTLNYKYAFTVKGRPILFCDKSKFKIPRISIENKNVVFWTTILKSFQKVEENSK